ncbi:MAG: FprA family A-type flavoprotein [Clostridia bacterium]
MPTIKVKDGIYSVGVLNPNLRIFDIIMQTEYGTSYNAYLVKGEKTALIETVHTTFFDEYLDNIRSITDIADIDYIILNHTEPDHSGALKYLLRENPKIKVITSMAGNKYIRQIVNHEFDSQIVKDGDVIDLGGKTLKFLIAPFLHWPDSMFTYVEEDSTLFSCDFLGCHYCEPRMFDNRVVYRKNFENAIKYYYDVIFGPFKEYVLKGLDKIKDLKMDVICPSHGPILVESIEKTMTLYREWSSDIFDKNAPKKVLISYVSAYGCTRRIAEELERAIKDTGNFEVELVNIIYSDLMEIREKIDKADALLFGSPTINRDAVKPVWDVLSVVEAIRNKGKLCGVFGSYGWSGESIKMMEDRVKSLKLNLFGEGQKANFVPSADELSKIYEYGVAFAKVLM